ncbi:MAG: transcription termination/antitermination protein NusA [Deltaproteobacteria bacterium]|nr:transcription termination/antitermination protein NusA [Deltaproteobacteria bacterium]MBW1959862.1 transcription termination/antitermination protein NusA [Deltaproteobacteria bacterium]MBW1993366.1 transcription termination/antitermination protein NusA [Deltaproteobacteria bacterium]MBW2150376.1 transcription termination/antitermination protein NusA [Deltaproteobacteria bacterium]
MFIADIKRVVDQVSRDKGIDREVLIKALEEALKSAARKKYGNKIDIEVQYDDDTGEIEVFQFKEVVEKITEPDLQITLEEALKLDPGCEIGDSIGTKMDTATFGRIAAQSAKQVIIQKMKDAEKDAVYSSFIGRKGEIINGICQRIDRGDIIVNLGQTEGILPLREQVPNETYRRGDRIRALILDVLHETRGPQIVLSRTHPDFLINLFKTEVPEISEGIVKVMGAAREPGSRSKFAVASSDPDIDPVGACVGMKGSRVQNVVQELKGEKIDIIPWHADAAKYVCNALAPAEISRVIIDEENMSMEVIVPDEHLSVAIGKRGQNVRLASKLTGWHLDVKSETRYSEAMKDGYDSLVALPNVGISLADALYEQGFYSAEELSKAPIEDLMQVRGIDEKKAAELIELAAKAVQEAEAEAAAEQEANTEPEEQASGQPEMEAVVTEEIQQNLPTEEQEIDRTHQPDKEEKT